MNIIQDLRTFSCALQHREYAQITNPDESLFMENTVKRVSQAMYVTEEEIMSDSTSDRASFPRKVSMYIIRKRSNIPPERICQFFGRGKRSFHRSVSDIEAAVKIYRETRELVNLLLNS